MIIQLTGNIINKILRVHHCLIRLQTQALIDSNKIQLCPIRAKNKYKAALTGSTESTAETC